MVDAGKTSQSVRTGPTHGTLVFLVVLFAAGLALTIWGLARSLHPILPAQNVADAAKSYLRGIKATPLSAPLEKLLADARSTFEPSQPHPLLKLRAPEITLVDMDSKSRTFGDALKRGPVVLVFYYGYHCDHCVSQLFDLNEDLAKFRELGAEVIAISADPPELTRERYRTFGAFGFPVLSDRNHSVAQLYGVYRPATGKDAEWKAHGCFVIGRDGLVSWANIGDLPFSGNGTLLYEIARSEGRLPTQPAIGEPKP